LQTDPERAGTVYRASEAISREQALRLYTSAAAHYTFDEGRKGALEPGKLSDLVVLSAGFMSVPEDQIRDIKADVTSRPGQGCFPALSRCRVSWQCGFSADRGKARILELLTVASSGGRASSLHHCAIDDVLDLLTVVFPKLARRRRSHDNHEPLLRVTEELRPIGAIPSELTRVARHG
jgi:hypothetical protein